MSPTSRNARFSSEQKSTVLLLTHIEAALTHTRFRSPSACVCVCTGFGQLAVRLRLSDADRFADLGSGLGKCVLQAATDHNVADAVGIEFSPSRHEMAKRSRDALPTAVASRVRFIEGDCASVGLWEGADTPLAGATVVWVCSTCFGAHLMERICGRLEAAASVRAVASLRPFVQLRGFAEAMPPEPCEMSWNAAAKLAAIGVGAEAPSNSSTTRKRAAMLSTCTSMNASGHHQGSALTHGRQFGMVRPKTQPIETICY